jgi:hypothetical protein
MASETLGSVGRSPRSDGAHLSIDDVRPMRAEAGAVANRRSRRSRTDCLLPVVVHVRSDSWIGVHGAHARRAVVVTNRVVVEVLRAQHGALRSPPNDSLSLPRFPDTYGL